MDFQKDDFIRNMRYKLHDGIKLTEAEIDIVISALIKAKGYTQEPYYELVYHDQYDKKEHRIMQPEFSYTIKEGDIYVRKETFELEFNRILREEEIEELKGHEDN